MLTTGLAFAVVLSGDSLVRARPGEQWPAFGPDTAVTTPWAEGGYLSRPFSATWELQDTVRRRRRAIAVSDGYATRLKIHQIGAYAMLPLVATQFILGQSLYDSDDRPSGLRTAHRLTAIAIGTVASVNTITGALNWWETRRNPEGRTRRTIHALLMLAADAGFVATALAASDAAEGDDDGASRHRALAITSISVSAASAIMMWLWKG
jgi:hypothetical protein